MSLAVKLEGAADQAENVTAGCRRRGWRVQGTYLGLGDGEEQKPFDELLDKI